MKHRVLKFAGVMPATLVLSLSLLALADPSLAQSGPPVAAYAFDEGTGTTLTDASGNNFHGTLTNGPIWTIGQHGSALQFNASDDGNDDNDPRVVLGRAINIPDLPLTISAWVHPTSYADFRAIISKRDSTDPSDLRLDVGLWVQTGQVYVFNGSPSIFSYAPPLNTWTHLAVVADSSGTRLYVNGVLQETIGAIALGTGNSANTVIGGSGEGNGGDNDPFKGKIDDLRIYNRALNAAEIQADMNAAVLPIAPETTPPSTPTGLAATAANGTQIDLAWTASTDNVWVAGYRIERCQGAECTNFVQVATSATNSVGNAGLAPSTTYRYRVRAFDPAGNLSAYSNVASATTLNMASPGPIASYAFDDGSGTTLTDASGNAFHGTLTNGPIWTVGQHGSALQFNASDDSNDDNDPRVVLGRVINIPDLPLTISAWINPTDYADWRAIISKRDSTAASDMRLDVGLSAGSGRVYLFDGSSLTFHYAPPINTWTHLAVVADSGGTRLYVSGVLLQTLGVVTLGTNASANTVIGGTGEGYGGDNDPFKGKIDDLRIYNRALSAAEILADMSVPAAVPPPVLDTIVPNQAAAGSASLVLTLNGSHFIGSSQAHFGSTQLTTRWLSETRLEADVPASLLASAGTRSVLVRTPPPGGGDSNILVFTVTGQLAVTALSPSSGSPGTAVTIIGTGFEPNAGGNLVVFAGNALATVTQATATELVVTVPATAQTGPITVTNAGGTATSPPFNVILASADLSVPDTTIVAPAVNPTVASRLADTTAFLYSGANPVQTGVAAGTIVATRAAVLRGRVTTRDDQPLPGIKITVLGHPEFGQTLTRQNGAFDMAVNGGGVLTIRYEKPGFLPVQRQVNTPWQDFVVAPDVVMIPLDTQVTAIAANATNIQVARGSVTSDGDGLRRATLLFAPGTAATMTLPGGGTQALSTLSVRATEFTVGPNSPKAMPAVLPPTSGYTYAAELSADEAVAAGAKEVRFSQPVPVYVENFLNFPVGGIVPAGYYDREKGAWIPAPNGRVIKILAVANGIADLDTDGDGLADDATKLAALNITDAERQQLAALYQPGASLWRVPVDHFTPWDFNWPYGPPPDATPPDLPPPDTDKDEDNPCEEGGSIIGCQNQTLGERLAVIGTPLTLNYRSDLVPGKRTPLTVQLSGASVPGSLKRIELSFSVGGRYFKQTFPAAPNQRTIFIWDGLDAYGRALQGRQAVAVQIAYVYGFVRYQDPASFAQSFARISGFPTNGLEPRRVEFTSYQVWWGAFEESLGAWDARSQGFGAWTASIHHAYDPAARVLTLGDGTRRSATDINRTITTVAGNGAKDFGGDGGAATAASLDDPSGIVVDPQGSLLIADFFNHRIRKVSPDGVITTVAGNGTEGFSGDGGPATSASLNRPADVVVDPQGNLFIADFGNDRIRKVSPDGIITTVAGNGTPGFSGDGGPATEASMNFVGNLTVDPQGNLFIADSGNGRIRQVSPDGIITTVAGSGAQGFGGDGGPATAAKLDPIDVIVDAQGNLFIADFGNNRVRKVSPDGIITTVAGNGTSAFSGDGGPATAASLNLPAGLALDPRGNLLIVDYQNNRIRRVSPDGIINTVAGTGVVGFNGDGGPAAAASFRFSSNMALDPQGNLFISDQLNHRIRKVAPPFPGFDGNNLLIPSADAAQIYEFDSAGHHSRTRNAQTQAVVHAFDYDAHGYLIQITDGDGNKTLIERDGTGKPSAIVSADGQRTTLTLDANGYLDSVTNPAGEVTRMVYSPDGLLTRYTDPRGNASNMQYDAAGRLTRDENAASGFWNLVRNGVAGGHQVSMSSAENRTTNYRVENLATGDKRLTNVQPDGTQATTLIQRIGASIATAPEGTITRTVEGPDPRFGMRAPIASSVTTTTPSGLTRSLSATRAATLSDPNNPLSLVTQTDTVMVNGRATTTVFTAATRESATTSPQGRSAVIRTDAQGRPVFAQIGGLEASQIGYDARGRLSTITQGSGADTRTLTYAYGADGFVERITDALTRQVIYQRDSAGRPTQTTLPGGRVLGMSFDANGNLTSIVPPAKPAHGFGYTPIDLEAQYNPPALPGIADASTRLTYNRDRDLTQISRPDGSSIAFSYNAGGKVAAVTPSVGAGSAVSYGYSATTGQLASIGSADAALSMSYDGPLLTQEVTSGAISASIDRSYDADFRITSLTINSLSTAHGYDFDGLLTKAGSLSITRDPGHGAITGTALGSLTTSQGYNGFGELANFSSHHGTAPLLGYQLGYDKLGRITSKSETVMGGATTLYAYSYDNAGRLASVSQNGSLTASWGFDANGNRTQLDGATIASVDAQDRLLTYGITSYAYTAHGSLQEKTQGAQTTRYAYDAFGNLKSVELPGGGRIDYLTDGRDRRIGKKVNGVLVQGFVWQDQLRVAAELDGANNVTARFVYGERPNVPELMIKGGVTYRLLTDHLGSVRLVVNSGTGAIAQRIDYDAWGEVSSDSNPGFQPFGFAGGLYEPSTGLVRFGARDYDAQTGRWTAKDPIRFAAGDSNLYAYVRGNPVGLIDPTGEISAVGVVAIVVAIGIGTYVINSWIDRLNEMKQQREDVTNNTIKCASGNAEACNNLEDQQRNLVDRTKDAVNEGGRVKDVLGVPRKISRWDELLEKIKKYCP